MSLPRLPQEPVVDLFTKPQHSDVDIFAPEMVPDQIRHMPKPDWFDERDRSFFEPDWDNDPELADAYPTDEERKKVMLLADPCKWAETEIKVIDPESKQVVDYHPRWYQELLLQDTTRYQVWRLGRQTGKCLPGWVRVSTDDGAYVTVAELRKMKSQDRPGITSLQNNFKFTTKDGYDVLDNGVKEVFRLTTRTGREVDLTAEHPVLVFRTERPEWIPVKDVQLGDRIAVPSQTRFGIGSSYSDQELKFLGYMIGDGGTTCTTSHRWSSINERHIEEMRVIARELGAQLKRVSKSKCDYWFKSIVSGRNNHQINRFLKDADIAEHNAHTKKVPKDIFRGTEAQVALFLNRLYATDGWACVSEEYKGRAEIGFCSVSGELAHDVHSLLLKFGIIASLSRKRVKYNGGIRIAYQVIISAAADIKMFARKIGIFGKEEAVLEVVKALASRAITGNRKIDAIPAGVMSYVDVRRRMKGLTKRAVVGGSTYDNKRLRLGDSPSRKKLKRYAKNLGGDSYLEGLADSEVIWDPVVSIESLGRHQTYDLSDVDGTYNFVANDVVVHNTTSIMIKALHHAFTHPNSKVLILTPYDEQVKKIFWDRPGINFMIENSETLQASVVGRLTKSPPYRVRFNNGSTITGMTAGTKSGAGGGASRGKDSDFIILDEADYLDDNDLRTIMGIRIGNPHIRIIASSTPSGARGMWYKWNTDPRKRWMVHHYPSSVVPYWDNIMDYDVYGNPVTFGEEILAGFDEYGIITEVLAEFPEELAGVFQKWYLDIMFGDQQVIEAAGLKSFSNYTYPARFNPKTRKRVMGVDVDKYATGPEIVIVEWNDKYNKAFILQRVTMPKGRKGELTLHALVDKIIELDRKWKTSYIYVDRGYGEMVVENLHKYGKEHPETGLGKRVVPIFYGEHVEIPDPYKRGEFTKVPIKPYLVQLGVRLTEQCALVASKKDMKLKEQMENYQVVARSATTGQPRYTMKNEHALDALLFALFGLISNFSNELIFPRGSKGAVVRHGRQGPGVHGKYYIDPYTDAKKPKEDPRMNGGVLQIYDIPPSGRKPVAPRGRRGRIGTNRRMPGASNRSVWGRGYRGR